MTSVKLAGLISALSITFTGAGFAQQGSEAQREACTPDAFRLCMSAMPDSGRVEGCLRAAGPRLSPACYAVFNPPQSEQMIAQRDRRSPRDGQRQLERPRSEQPRDDGFSGFQQREYQSRQPQPQFDDD